MSVRQGKGWYNLSIGTNSPLVGHQTDLGFPARGAWWIRTLSPFSTTAGFLPWPRTGPARPRMSETCVLMPWFGFLPPKFTSKDSSHLQNDKKNGKVEKSASSAPFRGVPSASEDQALGVQAGHPADEDMNRSFSLLVLETLVALLKHNQV